MRLTVWVPGRPAPQGSHEVGQHGRVMHSSHYLSAWRLAVNRAVREEYLARGLTRENMPLIPNPQGVSLWIGHCMLLEQCRAEGTDLPTGVPDLDKLVRATIDGLGVARVFANDSQVTFLAAWKIRHPLGQSGAMITIDTQAVAVPPEWTAG